MLGAFRHALMAASSGAAQLMELSADALPHPLLTQLVAATPGHEAELSDDQKAMLLAEAETCISAMRTRRDDDGWIVPKKAHSLEPEYLAAALANMCGYFRKKNGQRLVCGPHGAAAAFGRPGTSRATLVTDKQAQLERLEIVLRQEAAGRANVEATAAGVADERAREEADARERILANVIAQNVWMPRYRELGVGETYMALTAMGWHDGFGGEFCQARVEEAMVEARKQYAVILDKCRHEMWLVYQDHFEQRRPQLHKATFTDESILGELSAADVRGALEQRGFSFPYAMVRGEMAAVKREYLAGFSVEEMERAYIAGPPPPPPPPRDATDALIADMLECRLEDRQLAGRRAARTLALLELTPLDQLERNYGRTERVKVEQSRLWLEEAASQATSASDDDSMGLPPLRPGGRVKINRLRSQPHLNGQCGDLIQWLADADKWWVELRDGTEIKVRPKNLVALPDSEPWLDSDGEADTGWGEAVARFSWAERQPLQARSIGVRFDDGGRPIWFPPPPAHVLEALTPEQREKIFSGALDEYVEMLKPLAIPHDMSYMHVR